MKNNFNTRFKNLKIKYKSDKKKYVVVLSSILLLFSLVIGVSYSNIIDIGKTSNKTVIEAGTLALEIYNESNSISFNGALPQEDSEAIENNKEYSFTLKNSGSLTSTFKIKLDNTCSVGKNIDGEVIDKCIPNKYIKVALKEGNSEYEVLEYDEVKNEYILDSDYLESGKQRDYKMKIWLSEDAPNEYNAVNDEIIAYSAKLSASYEQGEEEYPKNSYIIVYDGNYENAQTVEQKVGVGEVATVKSNLFLRQGYIFLGYSLEKDGEVVYEAGDQIRETTNLSGGKIVLYAVWELNTKTAYRVEHYVMNTSGSYPTTATNVENKGGVTDASLTLSNLKLTTAAYNVPNGILYSHGTVGGNTATTTTILADGSRVIKLYYKRTYGTLTTAKGTEIASVTAQNSVKYYYGATVPAISATLASTTGYTTTFSSWTSSNTTYISNKTTKDIASFTWPAMPEGTAITLTAKAAKSVINYSITYNLDGGTVATANPGSYNIETTTFSLNNPTKAGYTFAGWTGSNGSSASTSVSIAKGSTGNKTYTANWTAINYTITYDLGGGTVATVNPSSYNIETTTFSLNNPTRTGYTFTGWTGSNGSSASTSVSIAKGTTGNKAYTANWKANIYQVTLDGQGANTAGTASVYYEYNTTKTINDVLCYYYTTSAVSTCLPNGYSITKPVKTGYTFMGYYTATNGGGTQYVNANGSFVNSLYKTTGNRTLYAYWTLKTKTVSFKIAYDTSEYAAPNATLLAKQSVPSDISIPYRSAKSVTVKPAVPADRYEFTGMTCTNGIDLGNYNAGTLSVASNGENTRSDTISVNNSSDTTTASVCTIKYKPLWNGIAYKTYAAGDTLNWADTSYSWTALKDNGMNVGVAYNAVTGAGAYANAASGITISYRPDETLDGYSELVKQSSGKYFKAANSSLGYDAGNYIYWLDSSHFYNPSAKNYYTLNKYLYSGGYTSGRGVVMEPSGSIMSTSYSTAVAIAKGSVSTSGTNYSTSSGEITVKNGYIDSVADNSFLSRYKTLVTATGGTTSAFKYDNVVHRLNLVSNNPVTEEVSGTANSFTTTYRITAYFCGGTTPGKRLVFRYKDATSFYYGNEGTGTGWDGTSFSTTNAVAYNYSSTNGNMAARFSGRAGTDCTAGSEVNCTSTTISSNTRYHRTYRYDNYSNNAYCSKVTIYETGSKTYPVYYRPYAEVRKR